MPVVYPLLQGGCMGGGERAPVALCRDPTEPAGETRGWAAPVPSKTAGETGEARLGSPYGGAVAAGD